MLTNKLLLSSILMAMPLTAMAGPGPGVPGLGLGQPTGSSHDESNACYAVNRDGRTCEDVGYREDEAGFPWGEAAGKFLCHNSCLVYLGAY